MIGASQASGLTAVGVGRAARPKWHRLYYLLAAFDLFTVVVSLVLNHQTRGVFAGSIEVNQVWSQRLADYSELGQLAAAVDAPGNDIFDSLDVDAETARFQTVLQRYDERFAVLRDEVQADAGEAEAAHVLADLDDVAEAMSGMTQQAEEIFAFFAQGQRAEAARHMATMDRTYARVNTAMADLRRDVRAIQEENLAEQEATANDLSKFEYLIAGAIVLMVSAATVYGHKIAKKVDEGAQERALVGQLEDAVRARDEFLSIAAHELRTPVTAIKAAAQLMGIMQASGSPDPTRLVRALRNLEEGAEQLGRLTEDLLDVSRLRTGRLQLRLAALDLAALPRRVAAAPEVRLGGGPGLALEVDATACEVLADEARVEQVITNLLDNAVKYSPDGGVVRVAVRAEGEGGLVSVQDQGIGLPPGAAEKIFEPFGRAANAQERQIQGMGLGLYISRQIAESHGGRLWAESAGENRGTIVSLWLPAHGPTHAQEEQIDDRAAEARAGGRGRYLDPRHTGAGAGDAGV